MDILFTHNGKKAAVVFPEGSVFHSIFQDMLEANKEATLVETLSDNDLDLGAGPFSHMGWGCYYLKDQSS